MIQWSAHKYYGSASPWVALVTGRDAKYTYARSFVAPAARSRSRSGKTGDVTWQIDEPGLYQCRFPRRQHDDGGWRIVWSTADGQLKWTQVDDDRAMRIVKLMDSGESFEAARCATKPPPQPTTAAGNP